MLKLTKRLRKQIVKQSFENKPAARYKQDIMSDGVDKIFNVLARSTTKTSMITR